ncbi:DNA-binding transcriptional MocR family regulator [Dongia mobilis]|uniref:DNA-binding transcriptional MocR family regulator n=1 Tax=Dongia mobilis TaxID=578943 RepID=A0A4R6WTD2_9PROT|nr:PLP-dependent aminotransferase family protein [Dongia mobilis]TDQ83288.1 DNA-binding transcriptional MocR family regulator [Dongia mobilis]
MLDFSLEPETGALSARIAAAIGRKIRTGAAGPGEKLPSVRKLAARLAVSPFTIVAAYDRLVAEGLVMARPKSGFFVAAPAAAPRATLSLDPLPSSRTGINPIWMMRQTLSTGSDREKPGCGWLPPDWLPDSALRAALRTVARTGTRSTEAADLVEYGVPLGFRPLREMLARRLNELEIPAETDRLLLTDSASQAIDLVCRYLVAPGDTVLVDDPGYFNFHAAVRAQRATCLAVPLTPTGPDLDVLERLAAVHRPKLYLTNAGPQNPTGARLGIACAHRLLDLARRHDFRILEDDIFRDFEARPGIRLAALDALQRVIHIGSFSKTLSAAMRIGFISADPATLADLADLKLAASFGNNEVSARAIHRLLADGSYRKHVAALRDRLARCRGLVMKRLTRIGLRPWLPAAAETGEGLFLWMELPLGQDALPVAHLARQRGMILAAGAIFSPNDETDGRWSTYMRFNVAQSQDPQLASFLSAALS